MIISSGNLSPFVKEKWGDAWRRDEADTYWDIPIVFGQANSWIVGELKEDAAEERVDAKPDPLVFLKWSALEP